jgi:hypothetical protein
MNPTFALWFGLFLGTVISLVVTMIYVLIVNVGARRIWLFIWILCVLIIWGINFGLIVWYNTPLGPSLNLE